MKNIALIPNPTRDKGLVITEKIAKRLISHGATVYLEDKFSLSISGVNYYSAFPSEMDLIIVTGGDGSVIDASRYAIDSGALILGVNLGKVGYLSEVDPSNLEIIDRIFTGEYKIDEKMLLETTVDSEGSSLKSDRLAVNDVIISHDTFLGIADISLENSSGDHVKYRADGMILSTPAGSTAYSLSAGGPIVVHDVNSIVATPICPHSFFNRSIVFKPTEEIRLINTGTPSLNVSVDGRFFATLKTGDSCSVKMSDRKIKMLTFSENNMLDALFKKMRALEGI